MHRTRTAALLTTGALVAVPLALVTTGAAQADTDRSGALAGGGRYELSVDRDDDRRATFEVSVGVDDVRPGSRYTFVVRQDGKRFVRQTVTADDEGDVDIERLRPDTAGRDRFVLVVTDVSSGARSKAVIVR